MTSNKLGRALSMVAAALVVSSGIAGASASAATYKTCGAGRIKAVMVNIGNSTGNSVWFALDNKLKTPSDMTDFVIQNNMSFIRVLDHDNSPQWKPYLAAIQAAYVAGLPVTVSSASSSCRFMIRQSQPTNMGFAVCNSEDHCDFVPYQN